MKKVIVILIINFAGLHFSFGQSSFPCDTVVFGGDMSGPNTPVFDTLKCDIYTPMGSLVETYAMGGEFTLRARKYQDSILMIEFPNIDTIHTYDGVSTTRMFNCHGYAWLRMEQGIDRWIGYFGGKSIPDQYVYMTDGSYIEVPNETYPGKVSWVGGDHSAVTTDQSGWVISKWRDLVLCKHRLDYGYYATTPDKVKYYIKNPCTYETPPVNIMNQTINTDQTIEDCRINVQDVNVTNGSELILDAELETTIDGDFEIELGSELEIK